MEVPRYWRLQRARYRLEGNICPNCGQKHFPARLVCPGCEEEKKPADNLAEVVVLIPRNSVVKDDVVMVYNRP